MKAYIHTDVLPSLARGYWLVQPPVNELWQCLVLSCLLTLYTAVMSFEILFPFGLWEVSCLCLLVLVFVENRKVRTTERPASCKQASAQC